MHTFTHTQTLLLHSSGMSHPSPQWDPMEQWMAHTAPSSKAVGTLSFKSNTDPQTAAGACIGEVCSCSQEGPVWETGGVVVWLWFSVEKVRNVVGFSRCGTNMDYCNLIKCDEWLLEGCLRCQVYS